MGSSRMVRSLLLSSASLSLMPRMVCRPSCVSLLGRAARDGLTQANAGGGACKVQDKSRPAALPLFLCS